MSTDHIKPTDFNAAADRRAYEKSRLPEELRQRVEEITREAAEKKDRMQNDQAERRDSDVAQERAKQRLEHPTKTLDDLSMKGVVRGQPSEEMIERRAVHAVDRRNALSLNAVDQSRDAAIDQILADHRQAPTSTLDRDTRDVNLGGDFTRASGQDRGGPER